MALTFIETWNNSTFMGAYLNHKNFNLFKIDWKISSNFEEKTANSIKILYNNSIYMYMYSRINMMRSK